jgi:hypothetical protein
MSEFESKDIDDNPYRSPFESGYTPILPDEVGQCVTPTVLDMLRQTQPWVRFLSVLGFISSGLMVLIGVGGAVAMMSRGIGFIFLIYVPMALLYFVPSLFLFRYASRIAELRVIRGVKQLEDALAAQKSFWKFVGIAAMVVIAIYLLMLVGAFVLPLMMGGMLRPH